METADSATIRIDTAAVRQMARVLLQKSAAAQHQIPDSAAEVQHLASVVKRLQYWSDKVRAYDDNAIQGQFAEAEKCASALLAAVQSRLDGLKAEVVEASAALQPLATACLASYGMAVGDKRRDSGAVEFVVDGVSFRMADAGVELVVQATKTKPPRKPVVVRIPLKETAA